MFPLWGLGGFLSIIMDYTQISQKITDFIFLKIQADEMRQKLVDLEANPPKMLEKEVLTWDEAINYAETEKKYKQDIEIARMGIATRMQMTLDKEREMGNLLPISNKFILFPVQINGKEETYKIGYFPDSYGFRIEKIN